MMGPDPFLSHAVWVRVGDAERRVRVGSISGKALDVVGVAKLERPQNQPFRLIPLSHQNLISNSIKYSKENEKPVVPPKGIKDTFTVSRSFRHRFKSM